MSNDEFLKGNFKVKQPVVEDPVEVTTEGQRLAEELKKKALNSLGGSMVYVDRSPLVWDGDSEEGDSDEGPERK